jgi:hypothetical protein
VRRIPKSFRLLGHTITVHVLPRSRWPHEDCVGLFDPASNHIYVMRQSKSQTAHSFWHEVTHAMLFYMNHKLYSNEQFVDQLGGLVAQVIASSE